MKKYFLHDGTTQYGPFDMADLQSKIITPQTLVWYESLPQWKPAGEIEELSGLLNSKVPASQITSPPIVTVKEEDWSAKSYYYTDDHGQQGPFTLEQLKSRPIKSTTPVWYDPLLEWTTAGKVAGLKGIIDHVQQQVVVAPQRTEPVIKKQYYYMDKAGLQQGPFTLEQMSGKSITASTMIWYDPLPEWIKAEREESLRSVINTAVSAPAVAAGSDWSRKLFYYTDSTGQQGPFTLDQLRSKPINANTPVWYEPLTQWTTAGQVEVLRSLISPPGI
ncbi:MAG: GYF domain-containing protein [Chitinophagaceae bacterium]